MREYDDSSKKDRKNGRGGIMIIYENDSGKDLVFRILEDDMKQQADVLEKAITPQRILFGTEAKIDSDYKVTYNKSINIPKVESQQAFYAAQRHSSRLIRCVYLVKEKLCYGAIINGTKSAFEFDGQVVDLTTPDGEPLFSHNHSYGEVGRQSNIVSGSLGEDDISYTIARAVKHFKAMKDETGNPLGYKPDVIIVPINRMDLENRVHKLLKGKDYNGWTRIILPSWETEDDRIILMSTKANEELSGMVFFDNSPITVKGINNEDGSFELVLKDVKFEIKFNTYKHILLVGEGV